MPFKGKKKIKRGRDGDVAGCWISNRILFASGSLIPASLGWSSHHLLPLQGHWAPTDQGQVSPAFHRALINVMVLWRSQERTVINKPAPKGELETDQSEPLLCLPLSGRQSSSTWKHLCSFCLYLGPQILYIMESWGTEPTKNPPNPTPSLLYSLFSSVVQTSRVTGIHCSSLRTL